MCVCNTTNFREPSSSRTEKKYILLAMNSFKYEIIQKNKTVRRATLQSTSVIDRAIVRRRRAPFRCATLLSNTKSSQVLTPQSCKEQGARIKKRGGMSRIIFRSHPVPPDVAPVVQCAGSTRLYSARSQTWSCACVLREKAHSSA